VDFNEGLPHVIHSERPVSTDFEAGLKSAQCVVKFDMAMYQQMIEINNIETNMIPTREKILENGRISGNHMKPETDEKKNNGKRPRKKQKR